MLNKGELAEAKILSDLISRGYKVFIAIGHSGPIDLVVERSQTLEKVQVKYCESGGNIVRAHAYHNNRNKGVKKYTKCDIDWLAVYDKTTDTCYYIPAEELENGKRSFKLRVNTSSNYKNNQYETHFAKDYKSI
jgi:Holliday junction resolvase-like predicted endonuclease